MSLPLCESPTPARLRPIRPTVFLVTVIFFTNSQRLSSLGHHAVAKTVALAQVRPGMPPAGEMYLMYYNV
jgi:hypothetical protein